MHVLADVHDTALSELVAKLGYSGPRHRLPFHWPATGTFGPLPLFNQPAVVHAFAEVHETAVSSVSANREGAALNRHLPRVNRSAIGSATTRPAGVVLPSPTAVHCAADVQDPPDRNRAALGVRSMDHRDPFQRSTSANGSPVAGSKP
jgi:hypothetical protein